MKEKPCENLYRFDYMMLGRLQQDVEYFLGYGNRNEKHLFYGSYKEHVSEMIKLWKSLPAKPKWLSAVQLISYKKLGTVPTKISA